MSNSKIPARPSRNLTPETPTLGSEEVIYGHDSPPPKLSSEPYDASQNLLPELPSDPTPRPVSTDTVHMKSQEAPSIETLNFGSNGQPSEEEMLEQQKRQEAINRLPEGLKRSINRFFEHLSDDLSTEITINSPNSIGFKQKGQRFIDTEVDFVDTETYHAVLNSFLLPLTNTSDRIGTNPYLIEGQLVMEDNTGSGREPLVARVHMIVPPAVKNAQVTIVKKARNYFTIDALAQNGSMTTDMARLLKELARGRATVVFSGVSGSGKTTLLEAMSREFDISDRVILIEDIEELALPVKDVTSLLSHQPKPGDDPKKTVTLEWLVRQSKRMRPDRIVVGEVRGAEMAEFLTAANSGADGSMTTVHASSPRQAIQQMMLLALKSEHVKSEESILREIASTVQVIVQLSLINGKHIVEQIEEVSNTVNRSNLGIQTSTLYRYDRNTERFMFENPPEAALTEFLKQRGVNLSSPTNILQRF